MLRIPSRSTRVLGAIALLAVSSLIVGGVVFTSTENEQNAVETAGAALDQVRAVARDVADNVDEQESALDDYVLSGDTEALTRFHEASAAEVAAFESVRTQTFEFPDIESSLAELAALSETWRSSVAEPAIAARRTDDAAELGRFTSLAVRDHAGIEATSNELEELILREAAALAIRTDSLSGARLAGTATGFAGFLVSFAFALVVVRRFGRALERDAAEAGILNRFTEVTSFAGEDRQIAAANLAAIGRLVHPDASVTHVLNHSLDRAVPEATMGDAIADVLPLHDIGRCAGMLRGTMYVSDDLADDLSVRCPVYPAARGTLACIPLTSGEDVGAVHLYWSRPKAMPLELRSAVARITEHAALTIGNRRLLAALQGQANTDPRTGLANSRSFDVAVEQALSARASNEATSVLMLDLDEFKLFNDRHGHPAGDEALRSFAGVLRSCMRDGDVAARYGGEEFAVLLLGVDGTAALAIAERIRARTESTIIALAPGITDRVTVSIGVASAPEHGLERIALLRLADAALYRAKAAGRNRVRSVTDVLTTDGTVAATPIRSHAAPASPRPRRRAS